MDPQDMWFIIFQLYFRVHEVGTILLSLRAVIMNFCLVIIQRDLEQGVS